MARLYQLSGDDIGRTVDCDGTIVLGRGTESDIVVRGGSVSRRHARLQLGPGGWTITDLGSSNGTQVSGRKIQAETPLEDGVSFVLGAVEFRFREELPDEQVIGEERSQQPPARAAAPESPAAPEPAAPPDATPSAGGEASQAPTDIVLEGDWDASAVSVPSSPARSPAPPRPAAPPRTPAPAPAGSAQVTRDATAEASRRRAAALGGAGPSGEKRTSGGRRILQYNVVENRTGVLSTDLSQQPIWMRWLLYLLVAIVFCGALWAAFQLSAGLRSSEHPTGLDVEQDYSR